MPWIREGECKQCGQCCLNEMFYVPMLNERKVCMYLVKTDTGYDCKIRTDPIGIPKEHLEYWERECRDYPNPNRLDHTPDHNHHLQPTCGFKIYWSDG